MAEPKQQHRITRVRVEMWHDAGPDPVVFDTDGKHVLSAEMDVSTPVESIQSYEHVAHVHTGEGFLRLSVNWMDHAQRERELSAAFDPKA